MPTDPKYRLVTPPQPSTPERAACLRCGSFDLRGESNIYGSPVIIRGETMERGAVVLVYCRDCGKQQTVENPPQVRP